MCPRRNSNCKQRKIQTGLGAACIHCKECDVGGRLCTCLAAVAASAPIQILWVNQELVE